MQTIHIQKTRTMFIMTEVIPGADVKSFILMDNNFRKDAKNAYYKNRLLKK